MAPPVEDFLAVMSRDLDLSEVLFFLPREYIGQSGLIVFRILSNLQTVCLIIIVIFYNKY